MTDLRRPSPATRSPRWPAVSRQFQGWPFGRLRRRRWSALAEAALAADARAGGRRTRPGGRRRAAIWAAWPAVAAVLALLLAGAPAYAATGTGPPGSARGSAPSPARAKTPPPRHRKGAPAPLPQDLSATLPNMDTGEAVGDFTGAGHDELAYAQDGQLKIVNAAKYGGNVVRSVPTDLKATPNDGLPGVGVWETSDYSERSRILGLTGVKTAASAASIYMAGATWQDDNPSATYKLHLYKLPHDGSCASASCADVTTDNLPDIYQYSPYPYKDNVARMVVVTSLAVGVVGGRTLIAVGLSDEGIWIFNDNLQLVTKIQDMASPVKPGVSQTPVTALAFGPPTGPGQGGFLAAGVESDWETLFSYKLNADGTEQSMSHAGSANFFTIASAIANINGGTYAVYGVNTGPEEVVFAINIDTGKEFARYSYPDTQAGDQPAGLTPLTPYDGSPDDQQVVLSTYGTYGPEHDAALQYKDGKLTPIPIGDGGATVGTATQLELWFPGYAGGRLRVANDSAGPVDVAMASRPDLGFGCWLDTAVSQPPVAAFPAEDTPVPAGGVSDEYFAGALTGGPAGPDGSSCASAQGAGERAAYVIVTPAGDRDDEHIVKVAASAGGTLSVADQAGGYLTAALARTGPGGSWGAWQLTLTGGAAPAAAAAPTVTGVRLTSAPDPDTYQPPLSPAANDPCRPVYRFDVTGARWDHIAAPGQVAAQIPPMTAQGSTDGGKTWTDLGLLMPSANPARAGDEVTLGPASFYWQDPPGSASPPGVVPPGQTSQCPATGTAPLTDMRVVSGGLPSNDVVLKDLAAPPINGSNGATKVSGITVTPEAPNGGTATPRADGTDQVTLDITLTPDASSGGIILPTDPRYHLVYYRYGTTNTLVTGLYTPGDYTDYTAVGPYAANGSGGGQVIRNYLVTTSTAAQSLNGLINVSGTADGALSTGGGGSNGGSIAVGGQDNPLTPSGTATGGIAITGCATSSCPLTAPTPATPALFQAGGPDTGPVTGLQLQVQAITGRASLPLKVGTSNAHRLGSAPLTITPGQAKLLDTSGFFPSDTIDTVLVTSGQLVPALSIPIGNGG